MGMTAAERWTSRFDVGEAQSARATGMASSEQMYEQLDLDDPVIRDLMKRLRQDPRRELDTDVALIASWVEPDDVVIDVGGGWGRLGLALALRSREVINVEPSPALRTLFKRDAADAGIANVRIVESDWLAAGGVEGDVVLAVDMIYHVRDIVPFVEKMVAAARRRVIIQAGNLATYQHPELMRAVFGEEFEGPPGYPELLPVLWEMDILPDVHVVPVWFFPHVYPPVPTREEALEQLLQSPAWSSPEQQARVRDVIKADFDKYFEETPKGFRPSFWRDPRHLLITWQTGES